MIITIIVIVAIILALAVDVFCIAVGFLVILTRTKRFWGVGGIEWGLKAS